MFSVVIQNYLSLCQKYERKPYQGFIENIHCHSIIANLEETTLDQVELLASAMCTAESPSTSSSSPTGGDRKNTAATEGPLPKKGKEKQTTKATVPVGAHFLQIILRIDERNPKAATTVVRQNAKVLQGVSPSSVRYYYATHTGAALLDRPGRAPNVSKTDEDRNRNLLRLLLRGLHTVLSKSKLNPHLKVFHLQGVPLYRVPHSSRLLLTSLCEAGGALEEINFDRSAFYDPLSMNVTRPKSSASSPPSNTPALKDSEVHLFLDLFTPPPRRYSSEFLLFPNINVVSFERCGLRDTMEVCKGLQRLLLCSGTAASVREWKQSLRQEAPVPVRGASTGGGATVKGLRYLNLAYNALGDRCLAFIAATLAEGGGCPSLQYLYLQHNTSITVKGLKQFANSTAIEAATSLRQLDLSGVPFREEAATAIDHPPSSSSPATLEEYFPSGVLQQFECVTNSEDHKLLLCRRQDTSTTRQRKAPAVSETTCVVGNTIEHRASGTGEVPVPQDITVPPASSPPTNSDTNVNPSTSTSFPLPHEAAAFHPSGGGYSYPLSYPYPTATPTPLPTVLLPMMPLLVQGGATHPFSFLWEGGSSGGTAPTGTAAEASPPPRASSSLPSKEEEAATVGSHQEDSVCDPSLVETVNCGTNTDLPFETLIAMLAKTVTAAMKEEEEETLLPLYAMYEVPPDPLKAAQYKDSLVPFDTYLDKMTQQAAEEEQPRPLDEEERVRQEQFLLSLIARVEAFENSVLETLEHYKGDSRGYVDLLKRQLYGKLSDMGEAQQSELTELKLKMKQPRTPEEEEAEVLRKQLLGLIEEGMEQVGD